MSVLPISPELLLQMQDEMLERAQSGDIGDLAVTGQKQFVMVVCKNTYTENSYVVIRLTRENVMQILGGERPDFETITKEEMLNLYPTK